MEFQSLSRRELQVLCKKNKIPANITTSAMADALKSLDIVEGIEEISQQSQSESAAKSSVDSPDRSEVTSPFVPPTASRTRSRRNVNEDFQSLTPVSRTRGKARKTLVKDVDEAKADASETPAMVAQYSRRRAPVASTCKESRFNERAEEVDSKEGKKTPAQVEVTSQRTGTKEGGVQRVYSTRRSSRLEEKNREMVNELRDEDTEVLKRDLFTAEKGFSEDDLKKATEEKPEEKLKLGSNGEEELGQHSVDGDEASAITDDWKETTEEEPEKFDDLEVSSHLKHNELSDKENELGNGEDELIKYSGDDDAENELSKQHSGDDKAGNKQFKESFEIGSEDKTDAAEALKGEQLAEEDIADVTEIPSYEQLVIPMDGSDEISDCHGYSDICSSEMEIPVENTKETKDDEESDLKDIFGKEVKEAECVEEKEMGLIECKENQTSIDRIIDADTKSQFKCLTPAKKAANKAKLTASKIADASDNKENIGSGKKKDMDLNDFSVTQLKKMLKEKLQITKNEMVVKASTRSALQASHANQKGDAEKPKN